MLLLQETIWIFDLFGLINEVAVIAQRLYEVTELSILYYSCGKIQLCDLITYL